MLFTKVWKNPARAPALSASRDQHRCRSCRLRCPNLTEHNDKQVTTHKCYLAINRGCYLSVIYGEVYKMHVVPGRKLNWNKCFLKKSALDNTNNKNKYIKWKKQGRNQ